MKISLTLPLCIILFYAEVAEALELMGKLRGGRFIDISKEPFYTYMASIHLNGRIICSGTVMSLTHLLTAAQCIADLIQSEDPSQFNNYFALVVTANINIVSKPYSFERVEVNPDYNLISRPPNFNIGVITLTMKIDFGAEFVPLNNPVGNERYDRKCIVPGWIADNNRFGREPSFQLLRYSEVVVKNINKAPIGTTDNSWSSTHNLYYGFVTGNEYLEKIDIGAPIINRKTLRIRGILSHVPEAQSFNTIYVKLEPLLESVQDAMANRQHKNKCRKLLTRTKINLRASTSQAVDTELRL